MKPKMSAVLTDADQDKQIRHNYISEWNNRKKQAEGYCAMGKLACEANNINPDGLFKINEHSFLRKFYGVTQKQLEQDHSCPRCACDDTQVINMIIHLNDDHKFTYKQIALWLKSKKL